jgi:hypothetical protein
VGNLCPLGGGDGATPPQIIVVINAGNTINLKIRCGVCMGHSLNIDLNYN